MARKYLNTSKVSELTGKTYEEIIELIKSGVLTAHKSKAGLWKINTEDVVSVFHLDNLSHSTEERGKPIVEEAYTRCILNNEHYKEVVERVRNAKDSIVIATANFKRFRLFPTEEQGCKYTDGSRMIDILVNKAIDGVDVNVICSSASMGLSEDYDERDDIPENFNLQVCIRNHMKLVIVDEHFAYIGSGNMTSAGIGQGNASPGNFEIGIVTNDPQIISKAMAEFTSIIKGKRCKQCHRREKCENPIA